MSIGIYTRVSTSRQRHDSQRSEITKWLESNSIDPAQVTSYADKESGTTLKRPEFERLQKDIFSGLVKTVVLWKLDRLSRRLRDGVNILADWADRGLRVVVTSQQLEFNGTVGRMIAALLLGLAEIEWEFREERQRAGIELAKRKGLYKGRKKGSVKGKPQRMKELRDKGLAVGEIATALPRNEVRPLFFPVLFSSLRDPCGDERHDDSSAGSIRRRRPTAHRILCGMDGPAGARHRRGDINSRYSARRR